MAAASLSSQVQRGQLRAASKGWCTTGQDGTALPPLLAAAGLYRLLIGLDMACDRSMESAGAMATSELVSESTVAV